MCNDVIVIINILWSYFTYLFGKLRIVFNEDANLMKWFKLDIYPCQDVVNDIFQRFITQFKWISENI